MFTIDRKQAEREMRIKGGAWENTLYDVIVYDDEDQKIAAYPVTVRETQFSSCK
jgi:hypothetical protein